MLIVLNKKVKQFYRIPPEEIPPEVFSPEGMKNKLYMQFYLYDDDFANNANIQPEIINLKHVKQVQLFRYADEYRGICGNEHLKGANTKIIFNDNSIIHVIETLNEIAMKSGAIK